MNLTGLNFKPATHMKRDPHEYVVRNAANNEKYKELFQLIIEHGIWEAYGRRNYRYFYLGDGYKYWAMTDEITRSKVINRAEVTEKRG